MGRHLSIFAAALAVTGSLAVTSSGQALPLMPDRDPAKSVAAPVEQVQWHGGWRGGPGWRGGWGPGWRGGWGPGWRGPGWRGPGWYGRPGWYGGGWGYRPVVVGPGWGWGGGCGWGGCGWGTGVGFASGLVVGSALASSATAAPVYGSNAVAYCMQRFRSYNPRTGTYLGYDGLRHPCP